MGPSLGSFGPSWGQLEAPTAHRKRKGVTAKTHMFLKLLQVVGLLAGFLEGPGGTRNRLGAILRHRGGMSDAIMSRIEVSWATLETILVYLGLSWGHLGPKGTLCHLGAPPVQTQGGGEVNLPKQREERG